MMATSLSSQQVALQRQIANTANPPPSYSSSQLVAVSQTEPVAPSGILAYSGSTEHLSVTGMGYSLAGRASRENDIGARSTHGGQPSQRHNHTYENLPALQMAINAQSMGEPPTEGEVARLRGGASLQSGTALPPPVSSVPPSQQAASRPTLMDGRRRSCTIASSGPTTATQTPGGATVTRAKSAVTTATARPQDVGVKQQLPCSWNKVCGNTRTI